MSKTKQLAKNTAIIAFGRGIYQMIGLILVPIYTSHLSTTEYGMFDLALTYVALLAPMLTLQLEMAMFRLLIDREGESEPQNTIASSVLAIFTPIVLLVALAGIVFWTITDSHLVGLVFLYAVTFMIFSMLCQIARGIGLNKMFALSNIAAGIGMLAGAIIFVVYAKWGASGALAASIFGYFTAIIYLLLTVLSRMKIRRNKIERPVIKETLSYSLPLVPNGASLWLVGMSDRTIISIMLGIAANGIYAAAARFSAIYQGLFSIYYMSWTESVSRHIRSDGDGFISRAMSRSTVMFALISSCLILVVSLVFPYVVGANFSQAYSYIPPLFIATFLASIMSLYGSIYIALKSTKNIMYTTMTAAAISIVLSVLGVPIIGLLAPPIATAIAYTGIAIYRHRNLRKHNINVRYSALKINSSVLLLTLATTIYYIDVALITGVVLCLYGATAAFYYRTQIGKIIRKIKR